MSDFAYYGCVVVSAFLLVVGWGLLAQHKPIGAAALLLAVIILAPVVVEGINRDGPEL